MKSTYFTILILLSILLTNRSIAQNWTQIADFTGSERDDGTAFVIGNNAYCISGYQVGFFPTIDGRVFNGNTETWSNMASLPLGYQRQYATSFTFNNYGYLLGGVGSSSVLNDFWQYNATTNTWFQLANFTGSARQGMGSFIIKNKAYVLGGKLANNSLSNEVWEYNFTDSSWTQKNNIPVNGMWRGAAFAIDTLGYICFGANNTGYNHDMYKYNYINDTWHKINATPLPSRLYVSTSICNNKGILYGGVDSLNVFSNNLLAFNAIDSSFTTDPGLPTLACKGAMAFSLNNIFYITTGINTNYVRIKETWKNTNYVSNKELFIQDIKVYPNPTNNVLNIVLDNKKIETIQILVKNILGETVLNTKTSNSSQLDITTLKSGVYFLQIQNHKTIKFTKE